METSQLKQKKTLWPKLTTKLITEMIDTQNLNGDWGKRDVIQ